MDDLPDQGNEEHGGEEERGEPDHEPDESHGPVYGSRRRPARQGDVGPQGLRKAASATTLSAVTDSFKEFEASTLFCGRCKRATPVKKKLLLVLPTGNKYDYTCSVCGSGVGGKTDSDATDFYTTAPPRPPGARPPHRLR